MYADSSISDTTITSQGAVLANPDVHWDLCTDQELLDVYLLSGRKEALETLVKRYAPLVLSVARRHLRDPHDADDAFQTTFAVFLRSADRIRKRDSLAAWFYGTAYRTACRLRARRRTRTSDSQALDQLAGSGESVLFELARQCELDVLDEELQRLPKHLREPIVERFLLGKSMQVVAERLSLSIAAVDGRLRRGRERLRLSLARKGIGLTAVLASAACFQKQLMAQRPAPGNRLGWQSLEWLDGASRAANLQQRAHGEISVSSRILEFLVRREMKMHTWAQVRMMACWLAAGVGGLMIGLGGQFFAAYHAGLSGPGTSDGGATLVQIDGTVPFDAAPVTMVAARWDGEPPASPEANDPADDTFAISIREAAHAGKKQADWMARGSEVIEKRENTRERLSEEHALLDFRETPLQAVIEQLSETTRVPILIDFRALQNELGLSAEEPITISMKKPIRLRAALKLILEPLELTYYPNEEWIDVIPASHKKASVVRYYDLKNLVRDPSWMHGIIDTLERTVGMNWECLGGDDTLSALGCVLVARCPETIHEEIEECLANLARQDPNNFSGKGPPSDTGSGSLRGMGAGGMF
jgi:RNA polymerase sigma factor (sigma-70 family)